MSDCWLVVEDGVTPYNVQGEVEIASFEGELSLNEIGAWSATAVRGSPGADLLDLVIENRTAARCYARLAPGQAATLVGGGIIDTAIRDTAGHVIGVSGLGFGMELTDRVLPLLAIFTNSGEDPMPANLVLGLVMTSLTDWDVFGEVSRDVYYEARAVTVFEALLRIAELTGDSFRVGPGRELHWISTPVSSGLYADGGGEGPALEENEDVIAVTGLVQSRETKTLYTRIYPFGGGDDDYRLTLLHTTRNNAPGDLPGDYDDPAMTPVYTMHIDEDPANSYLERADQITAYGTIERIRTLDDIIPLTNNAAGLDAASNELYDTARALLDAAVTPHVFYALELGPPQQLPPPGETIYLDYHDFERTEAGTTNKWLDIGEAMLITVQSISFEAASGLALSLEIVDGVGTGGAPLDEAGVLNALWRKQHAASAYRLPGRRDETFTMPAEVIYNVFDDRVNEDSYIVIIPLNAEAVTRQAGAGALVALVGKGGIQFQTSDGVSADGDEEYRYMVVNGGGGGGLDPRGDLPLVEIAGQGYFLGTFIYLSQSSTAVGLGAANQVRCVQFVLPWAARVSRVGIVVVTTLASQVADAGLYDAAGALVCHTAGFDAGAGGAVSLALNTGEITLQPGVYYQAWTCTSTTPTFRAVSLSTGVDLLMNVHATDKMGVAANAATAGILPGTLGAIAGQAVSPILALFEP
jgi:hypothetical protein